MWVGLRKSKGGGKTLGQLAAARNCYQLRLRGMRWEEGYLKYLQLQRISTRNWTPLEKLLICIGPVVNSEAPWRLKWPGQSG